MTGWSDGHRQRARLSDATSAHGCGVLLLCSETLQRRCQVSQSRLRRSRYRDVGAENMYGNDPIAELSNGTFDPFDQVLLLTSGILLHASTTGPLLLSPDSRRARECGTVFRLVLDSDTFRCLAGYSHTRSESEAHEQPPHGGVLSQELRPINSQLSALCHEMPSLYLVGSWP